MISTFSFPTTIVFGCGAANEVGRIAAGHGVRRMLLVTDSGVVSAGLSQRLEDPLRSSKIAVIRYDQVGSNPTEDDVERGLQVYQGEDCDGVIAVGGGSVIDAAKGIRLRTSHPLPLEQYDDNIDGGAKIRHEMPLMMAVPTTAGTGSEVGRSTVIVCKSNRRKTVIFSPLLMPGFAICDPDLTLGLPPRLTAATGMDALTHNLEAYLSTPYHPLADAIALGGLRLCAKSLRRAFDDGGDREARQDMMMAAIMGATAFQKGLGVTHSLSHPLSTLCGMHHGAANAVLLPHVLEFNGSFCEDRYEDAAAAVGISSGEDLADWVREMNRAIGIPPALTDYGVTASQIPLLVEKAMEDGCYHLNPRPVSVQDMTDLYVAAL